MSTDEIESPVSGADEEAQVDEVKSEVDEVKSEVDEGKVKSEEGADDVAPAEEPPKKKKRTPKPKKPVEAPKVTKSGYPRTADMILYAIESLAERKGSSVQGIKNFILKTYPTVKKERLKSMLKQTLPNCLDQGAIKRPEGQEGMVPMAGRYKLVKAAKSSNPSCEEMVVSAVGALDERKGATVIAIKAWILDNYDHVRPEMLRHQIRMGLTKASAKGSVAPHTPGKTDKVSLAARWHIKGDAKKEIIAKRAEERKAEAAKAAAAKKRATATAVKKKASKKAPPKAKKAAPKKRRR